MFNKLNREMRKKFLLCTFKYMTVTMFDYHTNQEKSIVKKDNNINRIEYL